MKHTGDGVLATFSGPARAIGCAKALVAGVRDEVGLDVRAGIHTGEVEVVGDDVRGLAVHIASRICAEAGAGQVLVSRTTKELVLGSDVALGLHATRVLKGVPGEWQLYAVGDGAAAAPERPAPARTRAGDAVNLALARRAPRLFRAAVRAEQAATHALGRLPQLQR